MLTQELTTHRCLEHLTENERIELRQLQDKFDQEFDHDEYLYLVDVLVKASKAISTNAISVYMAARTVGAGKNAGTGRVTII